MFSCASYRMQAVAVAAAVLRLLPLAGVLAALWVFHSAG